MKRTLQWLFAICLFLASQSFYAQQIASKTEKPKYIGTPTKVEKVPSIASRVTLVRPELAGTKEMNDGRASKNKEIIIGKGSNGSDALAEAPHRLKNTIDTKEPLLVFETGASSSQPTDPAGAVGPNHYISVLNTAFQIFDKEGNSLTAGLVSPNPTIFPSGGCCDLTVSYDNAADRWVMSFLGGGAQLAISDGPDPVNDGWTVYTYGSVNDYQKVSVWHDGYYMTDNLSGTFHVFERAEMLAGNIGAQMVSFTVPGWQDPGGFDSPQFLNLSHDTAITGPAFMVYFADDGWGNVSQDDHIKLWDVTMDWANASGSTVTGPTNLGIDASGNADGSVTSFNSTFDGGSFVNLDQPSGGSSIDALQWTVMNQAQFRKFDSHNSALFNFVVDVDGSSVEQAGVRWYELRQSGDGQPWTIYQEGTYTAPDNRHAWNASLSMDIQGNIGMGYTGMSSANSTDSDIRVGSYYTGRFAGDDLGVMTVEEGTIIAGDSNIPGTRYGDYSKIDIDPDGDKKFWFVNEVMSGGRKNVAGVFQLAPNTTNDVGVVSIDTPTTGMLTDNETITVTVFNFGEATASGFDVTYQIDGGTIISEPFGRSLASQTAEQYIFSAKADLSIEGQTYTINACTDYDIDEDNSNDCASSDVLHEFANDIGIVGFTAPETGTFLSDETVSVTIKNFGTQDQTGFDINYIIDGGTPVVETVGVTLPAGESTSYSFTQTADLSELGTYNFSSSSLLAGDSNTTNDTALTTVVNSSCLTSTNTTAQGIGPDAGTVTTSTIFIGPEFSVQDVNVTINLNHTWDADLTITLTSPSNDSVLLSDGNGSSGDDYIDTVFDDDASSGIASGSAPFTGLFQPQGSLSDFNGLQSSGIWTLTITDNANQDGGTFNSWGLELCGDFTLSSNDIGVTDISSPNSGEGLGSESVTITIANFGTEDQSNFNVNYAVNGGTPVQETVSATVTPGNTLSYTFSTSADLSAFGIYALTSTTLLPGDADTANDSASIEVTNISCSTEENDTNFGISDNGIPAESIINITNDIVVDDIDVTLNIFHVNDSDLEIKLVAPNNATEVMLSDRNGGSGSNYTNTVFDDDAGAGISSGSAPFEGVFTPDGDLNDFNGLSALGDWKLVVTDRLGNSLGGALLDWTIRICARTPALSIGDNDMNDDSFEVIYNGDNRYSVKLRTSSINDQLDLTVQNTLGQTLLWKTLDNENGQGYEYDLNMSYASAGVYFVRIGNRRFKYVRRIIVK